MIRPWLSDTPAALVATTLVVGVCSGLGCRQRPAGVDVPLYATPAWGTPGELALRPAPGGGLLARRSPEGAVYAWGPEAGAPELADRSRWEAAETAITECRAQRLADPRVVRIDPRSRKLQAGEREVATAGAQVLVTQLSPSGRWLAVLSADLERRGSLLPFAGQGGGRGAHYYEVLDAEDFTVAQEPRRLPFDSADKVVSLCWSSDERAIVWSDYFLTEIAILTFNQPGNHHS